MSQGEQCAIVRDLGPRSLTWTFVGLVYGFIHVSSAGVWSQFLSAPFHLVLATMFAPVLTAVLYGSMRLVVIVANAVFLVTLLAVMFGGGEAGFVQTLMLPVAAGLGAVIGGIYGWRDKHSRVFCADAKALSGLLAGATATLPVLGLLLLPAGLEAWFYPWAVAVTAPLSAAIYLASACWFVERMQNILPPVGDGALVGAVTGVCVGMIFLIIAGLFDMPGVSSAGSMLGWGNQHLGPALLGAVAGCLLLSLVRSVLGTRWYRL